MNAKEAMNKIPFLDHFSFLGKMSHHTILKTDFTLKIKTIKLHSSFFSQNSFYRPSAIRMKSLITTSDIIAGLCLVVLSFIAPVYSQLTGNLEGCATQEQADTITDFFPDKISTPLPFAKTFTISYHGTYKILTNVAQGEKYLLYQCGTAPPTDLINSEEFRVVTKIPLPDGVALTSTTQIRK